MEADRLEGYGIFSADGGSASCIGYNRDDMICGGGAGGRIAINLKESLEWWNGDVQTYGQAGSIGRSNGGVFGGAGTIYWSVDHNSGITTDWLQINNRRGLFEKC